MSAQAKRCMRWILAATCFFAVTFVAGHFYSSWMNRRFECSGIRTVAMVTDVTVEHHKEQYIRSYGAGKGRRLMRQAPYTKTTIRYFYEVNGVRYEGSASTRTVQPARVKTGERIPVEYLAEKPSKHRVVSCPQFRRSHNTFISRDRR